MKTSDFPTNFESLDKFEIFIQNNVSFSFSIYVDMKSSSVNGHNIMLSVNDSPLLISVGQKTHTNEIVPLPYAIYYITSLLEAIKKNKKQNFKKITVIKNFNPEPTLSPQTVEKLVVVEILDLDNNKKKKSFLFILNVEDYIKSHR